MTKTKKNNLRVEIFSILIGISYSLITYLSSLDGVFTKVGRVTTTYYEATDPEGFWNAIQVSMSIGGIIALCGLVMIYLQKQK